MRIFEFKGLNLQKFTILSLQEQSQAIYYPSLRASVTSVAIQNPCHTELFCKKAKYLKYHNKDIFVSATPCNPLGRYAQYDKKHRLPRFSSENLAMTIMWGIATKSCRLLAMTKKDKKFTKKDKK